MGPPAWHRFPAELPPERKLVLVQLGIGRTDDGLPAAMVAGYLKFAAGDKASPYFVTPGVDRRDERRVEFWCDCLPEAFQPPAWQFPDRPPARIATHPASTPPGPGTPPLPGDTDRRLLSDVCPFWCGLELADGRVLSCEGCKARAAGWARATAAANAGGQDGVGWIDQ